jgi:hypothetical protein
MSRIVFVFALLVSTLVVAVAPAGAYYGEVHYALTYYVARLIGCTPEQAYRISSADHAIDYSPPTEPVQGAYPTTGVQTPRWKFHAFRDESRFPESIGSMKDGPAADQAINQQGARLLAMGIEAKNAGVFLHFFQDRIPHARYGTEGGHWANAGDTMTPLGPVNFGMVVEHLDMGGSTDWLSYQHLKDPRRNILLVQQTAATIANTMQRIYRVPSGVPRPCLAPLPAESVYAPVLEVLRRANPHPAPIMPVDFRYIGRLFMLRKLGTNEESRAEKEYLEKQYGTHLSGPDLAASRQVINAALRQMGAVVRGAPEQMPLEYRKYQFDGEGNVVGSRDPWVMTGLLKVRLEGAASGTTLAVKMPPMRVGEAEYEMKRQPAPPPGTWAEFPEMPVGDLVVELLGAGAPIRKEVTLDKETVEVTIGSGGPPRAAPWRWGQ